MRSFQMPEIIINKFDAEDISMTETNPSDITPQTTALQKAQEAAQAANAAQIFVFNN
ncbi:MAG: hypothetical protein ACI38A_10650 [Candidatus Ornithomonoglobus sp.]